MKKNIQKTTNLTDPDFYKKVEDIDLICNKLELDASFVDSIKSVCPVHSFNLGASYENKKTRNVGMM